MQTQINPCVFATVPDKEHPVFCQRARPGFGLTAPGKNMPAWLEQR